MGLETRKRGFDLRFHSVPELSFATLTVDNVTNNAEVADTIARFYERAGARLADRTERTYGSGLSSPPTTEKADRTLGLAPPSTIDAD